LCKNLYQVTRRYWTLLALASTACRDPSRGAASLLPPRLAGWQRKSLRGIPPPKPAVLRAFEGKYEGAGKLTVDLYEAKVSGTAFEMTQHWREAPNTVFFDKGRYFVVVKWEQADREALTAFVRGLEKELEE
jgi:hypothetical protein